MPERLIDAIHLEKFCDLAGAVPDSNWVVKLDYVRKAPTVDAVRVVHGEWIDAALHALTMAREDWMLDHNEDADADYYAEIFEDARICLERLNDECSVRMDEEDEK